MEQLASSSVVATKCGDRNWRQGNAMGGVQPSSGVLIVEDEFLIALDIEDKFLELGFRDVHLAHTLERGRKLLHSKSIGLAFLDVNLGSELVFPLAQEIRARRIPIIFSTAHAPGHIPKEWTGYPILSKPLDRVRLAELLGRQGGAGTR